MVYAPSERLELGTSVSIIDSDVAGDIFRRLPQLTALDLGSKHHSHNSLGQEVFEGRCFVPGIRRDIEGKIWTVGVVRARSEVKFTEPRSELMEVTSDPSYFMRIGYSLSDY